jgi:hypothetical protein
MSKESSNVLEIDFTRFGLKTLFAIVTIISIALIVILFQVRAPCDGGVIYTATCYRQDWEHLVRRASKSLDGNLGVHKFNAARPADLFAEFAVKPVIWGDVSTDKLHSHTPERVRHSGWTSTGRYRPPDRPVDGIISNEERFHAEPKTVASEHFTVGGSVDRARFMNRYFINLDVRWNTVVGPPFIVIVLGAPNHKLQYTGPIHKELVIFAVAIAEDSELIRLVIVDFSK